MNIHELMRQVELLARRQHGVFHRQQILAVGVTPKMIVHRLKTKTWIRLAPNVYAISSHPPTWRRQYKAAQLATRDSAIAGLSAAHLLRWDGFRTVKPEVVSTHTAHHRSELATVHRACDVRTTIEDGISVTTHAQTLCDLLNRLRLDRWEQCADRLLLTSQMTTDELAERLSSYELSRRPGLPLLRQLVRDRSSDAWVPPESELETLLRGVVSLVRSCPQVTWQAPAPWASNERVDGLIAEWGLIIEADGRAWHARVHDFDKDRWRDNQAAAHGLRVQRFTYAHLVHRRDEVISIIEQAGRASISAA